MQIFVFHFLRIAKKAGIPYQRAIKHICIGSDYDGLINPIDCCTNSAGLPAFREEIRKRLKRGRKIWEGPGISKTALDVDELVDGLFFNNALTFLRQWFN